MIALLTRTSLLLAFLVATAAGAQEPAAGEAVPAEPAAAAPTAAQRVEDPPAAQPRAAEGTPAEPPPPARPPARTPLAPGRWAISVGATFEERGPAFTTGFSGGFAPIERLRIDARVWLGGPYHDSFSTAGMTFGGTHPADSPTGDLKIMRGGVEVAAALRGGRFEPRVALGWTLANASAETTYTVDTLLFGTWQNTASETNSSNGPCIAAGVDVVVHRSALLGFEIRKPFLAPVRLGGEIPLRVAVDSISVSMIFTARWGR